MVKRIWKAIKNFITLQREANSSMDRKVKKLTKELVKLDDAQVKEILEFLQEEADEEEVEETEQKEETKQEKVQEKVQEEKQEETKVTLGKSELEELLQQFASNFVTKEEYEKVKGEVQKAQKKAQPFGEKQKTSKVDKVEQPKLDDLLAKVNSQFV